MKKILFVLLSLMVLSSVSLCAVNESGISVSGNGQVSVDPDIAYITFGVSAVADSAQRSQVKAAESMTKVVETLTTLGITSEKIETSTFMVNPLLNYESGKTPKITGYKCDNQIRVTVDNLRVVGGLIDAGIAAGANSVSSISFAIKDEKKAKLEALENAVQDAKDKAAAIAKASGVEIKKVSSIVEGGANITPMEFSRTMMATNSETPIMSGKIKVYATVTVNYEI
jgi:uncharacterized protein